MSLLDLLFPTACAGCGADGPLGCLQCLAALFGAARPAWPQPVPPGLPPPWAVATYADPTRALLLAYKERGATGLRAALAVPLAAALLAASASASDPARIIVVPVPSTPRAVRGRGDDVVLGLTRRAVALARRSGADLRVVAALRHGRAVTDSAGLGAQDRAKNLAGALVVRPRAAPVFAGATVLLADDLITTGASLAECARALGAVGASVVGAATIAATQRLRSAGTDRWSASGSTVGLDGV